MSDRQTLRGHASRIRMMIGRAVLGGVDDTTRMQSVQVELLADEVQDAVERFQNYGLTSVPLAGAEAVMASVGGLRSHGVVIVIDDRRYRVKGLRPGEVVLYDDLGQVVHLTRDGILIKTAKAITIDAGEAILVKGATTINVEAGQDLLVKSTAKVTVDAADVDVVATGAVTVDAASASVTTSGDATLAAANVAVIATGAVAVGAASASVTTSGAVTIDAGSAALTAGGLVTVSAATVDVAAGLISLGGVGGKRVARIGDAVVGGVITGGSDKVFAA